MLCVWDAGTSSIDTTCTIWGLETGQVLGRVNLVSGHVKTQLIAHDKEVSCWMCPWQVYDVCVCVCPWQVYDIAFSRAGGGRDMFASVGADGSVRMFDLRHLEHSTIIYEDPQHHPLLRLCWNKQDPNYLATMAMDGMEVTAQTQQALTAGVLGWMCGTHFPSVCWWRVAGGDSGCACALHPCGSPQQPPRLRQRHRLGATLLLPHLHRR